MIKKANVFINFIKNKILIVIATGAITMRSTTSTNLLLIRSYTSKEIYSLIYPFLFGIQCIPLQIATCVLS